MYSPAYQVLVMSRPLSLQYTCIYIVISVKVVTYLQLYREWSLKTRLSGNFQKSKINTYYYTWNFGMYDSDTSSER